MKKIAKVTVGKSIGPVSLAPAKRFPSERRDAGYVELRCPRVGSDRQRPRR